MMKYIDRDGKETIEESGQDRLLRHLYTSRLGRILLKAMIRPEISRLGGWLLEQSWSRCLIGPFVRKNRIDLSCCLRQEFSSYNDFFTRKLKPQYRMPQGDEETLTSPCDGKLSVYPIKSGRS